MEVRVAPSSSCRFNFQVVRTTVGTPVQFNNQRTVCCQPMRSRSRLFPSADFKFSHFPVIHTRENVTTVLGDHFGVKKQEESLRIANCRAKLFLTSKSSVYANSRRWLDGRDSVDCVRCAQDRNLTAMVVVTKYTIHNVRRVPKKSYGTRFLQSWIGCYGDSGVPAEYGGRNKMLPKWSSAGHGHGQHGAAFSGESTLTKLSTLKWLFHLLMV